jgi:metal-sulfur cluster biosynthetic enzyme
MIKTLNEIKKEISKVRHPAIDYSLVKLGIVQDIDLLENSVIVTFVFPFPNIPIADKLIASVVEPINRMGLKPEYIVRIMNEDEKARFLQLEKEAWTGM